VVTARTERIHPHGDLACHVLGYLRTVGSTEEYEQLKAQGRIIQRGFNELEDFEKISENPYFHDDEVGAAGIERVYDEVLQGKKGARLLEKDTRTPESIVLAEIPPKSGATLFLTLDAKVQRAAQDALSATGSPGAAIVMDVENGEIIAMASSPSYDLDSFKSSNEEFQEHLREPYPLINRALSGLAPGSGFKLVTAIAALEDGVITPQTHVYCRGYYKTPASFR
jgi:penicillin-binding protein 2